MTYKFYVIKFCYCFLNILYQCIVKCSSYLCTWIVQYFLLLRWKHVKSFCYYIQEIVKIKNCFHVKIFFFTKHCLCDTVIKSCFIAVILLSKLFQVVFLQNIMRGIYLSSEHFSTIYKFYKWKWLLISFNYSFHRYPIAMYCFSEILSIF